jgi:hypothetical protein
VGTGDFSPGSGEVALQRQNTKISKQIFPEKEYRGLSPNFHIHASVSDLYIPTISLPILLEEICRPILGLYNIAQRHMNVEIGAEGALFPEKEYINGIFFAVQVGLGGRGRLPAYLNFCFIRKKDNLTLSLVSGGKSANFERCMTWVVIY